jgi:G3E family GTPase
MNEERETVPVSVLTGFLGSGKTTLLNRLLHHPDMGETAVVVNEFGEIGIDNALVERAEDDVILMSSGCLCCTVRGELVDTLRSLYLRRVKQEIPEFKRLVIETTGLADPAPIIHTLMSDPYLQAHYRLDGIITTVDAVNGAGTLDNHAESVKQAAVADRIVLTKTDLPEAAARDELERRLKQLNPAAPIQPVSFGDVAPDALFGAGLYNPETKSMDVQRWLHEEAYADAHHHGHDHDHDHAHAHGQDPHDVNRHDDAVRAFCLYIDEPLPWNLAVTWLEMLANYRGQDMLRVKGLLNIVESEDRPIVIHGVQHLFHPPVQLDAWPSDDRRTRVVFIARNMGPEHVEDMLKTLKDANVNVRMV